jgi:hypothetical protein
MHLMVIPKQRRIVLGGDAVLGVLNKNFGTHNLVYFITQVFYINCLHSYARYQQE